MIENIFPIPVYKVNYEFEPGEREMLIELAEDDAEFSEPYNIEDGIHRNKVLEGDASTSYDTIHTLETHPAAERLNAFVLEQARNYWKELNWNTEVTPIPAKQWCTVYKYGGHVTPHNHGFAPIACSFYLNVPENAAGDFVFLNPLEYTWTCNPFIAWETREFHKMNVKTGDLIFFPGWLKHASEPNMHPTEHRVIMSYNFAAAMCDEVFK
jgi:uncharacterized protein (TIGR02466 family)